MATAKLCSECHQQNLTSSFTPLLDYCIADTSFPGQMSETEDFFHIVSIQRQPRYIILQRALLQSNKIITVDNYKDNLTHQQLYSPLRTAWLLPKCSRTAVVRFAGQRSFAKVGVAVVLGRFGLLRMKSWYPLPLDITRMWDGREK